MFSNVATTKKSRQKVLKRPNLKCASELSQSNDKSSDSSIEVFVLVSSGLRGILEIITIRQQNIQPSKPVVK